MWIVAREELGQDIFILTCWGVAPGRCSIGLADGCRLGSDGFQWGTLLANSSTKGVLWRGDPDHCDIRAAGAKNKTTMKTFGAAAAMSDTIDRPCVVAMAGSVLMVSDKAEDYQNDSNLEGMKRSAPVLFTVPGQLYDGGGNGVWWLQEIDRSFDHWSVLARFNWRQEKLNWDRADNPQQEVKFADLGLDPEREYLVFEFWSQTFLGKSQGSFTAPAQDASTALQVFAIREARPHPWVLSTTRHISQGGVDLQDERWDASSQTLSGRSAVVVGDPYVLTVHLPEGFRLAGAEIDGEKAAVAHQGYVATVRSVPSATRTVGWTIQCAQAEGGHRNSPGRANLDNKAGLSASPFAVEPSAALVQTAVENEAGRAAVEAAAQNPLRVAAAAKAKATQASLEGWEMCPFVKHPEPVLRPNPNSVFTCPIMGKDARWEEM